MRYDIYIYTGCPRRNVKYFGRVFLRVNEQRNIIREIRKRKANWIGNLLRRKWLLKQVIEGKKREHRSKNEDEEENVRSYWMTLRAGKDTLI